MSPEFLFNWNSLHEVVKTVGNAALNTEGNGTRAELTVTLTSDVEKLRSARDDVFGPGDPPTLTSRSDSDGDVYVNGQKVTEHVFTATDPNTSLNINQSRT